MVWITPEHISASLPHKASHLTKGENHLALEAHLVAGIF